MSRMVLGALVALALVGLGAFWWQGRAQVERGAPPPQPGEAWPPGCSGYRPCLVTSHWAS